MRLHSNGRSKHTSYFSFLYYFVWGVFISWTWMIFNGPPEPAKEQSAANSLTVLVSGSGLAGLKTPTKNWGQGGLPAAERTYPVFWHYSCYALSFLFLPVCFESASETYRHCEHIPCQHSQIFSEFFETYKAPIFKLGARVHWIRSL